MRGRFLLLAIFILLCAPGALAQSGESPVSQTENKNPDKFHKEHDTDFPNEMLKKMEIARRESEHKKVLEDVEKLSDLTGEIAKNYGERKKVSAEDVKKLGAIEKLAKRVLTSAGGEEVDDNPGAAGNMTVTVAIDKLSTAAASIRKEMKAETRFVVSASVIANSNEVISLARFIRHNQKAD